MREGYGPGFYGRGQQAGRSADCWLLDLVLGFMQVDDLQMLQLAEPRARRQKM
jgi:hypothetical protein